MTEKQPFLTKKKLVILGFTLMPLFASWVMMYLVFPHGIPSEANVNPNMLTGLITLSGVIFAFQPVIFRTKKVWFNRFLAKVVYLYEGLLIGEVGYSFVSDALSSTGTFSGSSLWYVALSMFTNIAFTVYLVFADLFLEMEG